MGVVPHTNVQAIVNKHAEQLKQTTKIKKISLLQNCSGLIATEAAGYGLQKTTIK